jgi:hypothetical protein
LDEIRVGLKILVGNRTDKKQRAINICGGKGTAEATLEYQNHLSLWGGAMLFSSSLERPACKRCGIRMVLARISPDGPQYETWHYECLKCDRVLTEQRPIPIESMKTAKGWLSGELRPQSKGCEISRGILVRVYQGPDIRRRRPPDRIARTIDRPPRDRRTASGDRGSPTCLPGST